MYQRLLKEIFKDLIGTMMEVYIDDIVVKSHTLEVHPNNIQQVLDILDKTCMKLNSKKYSFGVKDKVFSYIVSKRA